MVVVLDELLSYAIEPISTDVNVLIMLSVILLFNALTKKMKGASL